MRAVHEFHGLTRMEGLAVHGFHGLTRIHEMGELALEDKTFGIIGCCMEVHKTLGAGYLEAVYQEALAVELESAGVSFEREKAIDISYKGRILRKKYFADFLCFDEVIVETKALSTLLPEHYAQVLNYLKATGKKVGLLVNFGASSLQWKRLVL